MALWRRNQEATDTDLDARDEIRVRRDDGLTERRDVDLNVLDGARSDEDLFVRRGEPSGIMNPPLTTPTTTPTTPQPIVTPAVAPPPVTQTQTVDKPVLVRGGLAVWAIVTGTVTALGAMVLFAAIVGGIAAQSDAASNTAAENITGYGTVAVLAFVFAQFFAYLWGGYAAGRMARGLGFLNGLLVPIVTLGLGAAVVGIAKAMGADPSVNVPFIGRASFGDVSISDTGLWIGIATMIAMFAGGIYGGILGARWHTRLEDPAVRPHGRYVE